MITYKKKRNDELTANIKDCARLMALWDIRHNQPSPVVSEDEGDLDDIMANLASRMEDYDDVLNIKDEMALDIDEDIWSGFV